MKIATLIRNAIHRFQEGIKPASARHVEALTQEIRLDTQRLLAEAPEPPKATPVEKNGKKAKEDSTGSFPAFHL